MARPATPSGRALLSARHDLSSPPPRLAVGDAGWSRFGPQLRVFLDRSEVQRCMAYDVEKGSVTRQRLDAAGHSFVDEKTNKVAVETITGLVEVKWR